MRHPIRVILIALVLLLGAAGAIFWVVSRSGSSAVEAWVGSQLKEMVNSRLNPQLAFDDLDYAYPDTVSLKRMRLVAQDPGQSGKTVDILACDSATITLAEIPRVGKPILIQKVVLDHPLFTAVAVEPGSKKVVGFSDMVREKPTSRPTTSAKLSELLSMRLVQINDGKIVYDPRIAGTEPMVLDEINTKLDITPAEGGWYKLATTISRKPIFELSVAGQLSLDTFDARDVALKLVADLNIDNLTYLPPQAQAFLKKYEIRGTADLLVMGEFPIPHPQRGQLDAELALRNTNVTLGKYRIPMDKLDISLSLEEGKLSCVKPAEITALEGSAKVEGSIAFNSQLDTTLKMQVMGMLIQNLLAGRKEGEPPRYAGKVDGEAQFYAPARVVFDTIRGQASQALSENWGTAEVKLTEGRLLNVSSIRRLSEMVTSAAKMVGGAGDDPKPNDRLNLSAKMTGDRAELAEVTYVSNMIAARGKGTISLPGQLDLKVNAGPIEKMQQMLGEHIGGAIAAVTDKIVAYRITGRVGDAKVEVEVAGGAVGKTIGKIGEGIGNMINPDK